MTWLLWLGLVLCLLAVAAVGLSAYGSKRWTDSTRTLTRRLEAARIDEKAQSPSAARFDSRELEGLPAPVRRYFRAALKEGQPIIAAVTDVRDREAARPSSQTMTHSLVVMLPAPEYESVHELDCWRAWLARQSAFPAEGFEEAR